MLRGAQIFSTIQTEANLVHTSHRAQQISPKSNFCGFPCLNWEKIRFKGMRDLIFSGTSRACLKISKSRSRAQKWKFRLNKEDFCGSDHERL